MKKRFTDDEIKHANETDILTIAQSRGYETKKSQASLIKFLIMEDFILKQME